MAAAADPSPELPRDVPPIVDLPPIVDVAVVGGGPAGRALAQRTAVLGREVAVIDPDPGRPWPATYGIWVDEIPRWLPAGAIGAVDPRATAFALAEHDLGRGYAMLDTPALQASLTGGPHVHEVTRRAVGVRRGRGHAEVLLAGGGSVAARVVVDASGPRRVVSAGPAPGARAAQTAFGLVVPDDGRHPRSFMDWRGDHGEGGWPSFLYAVPLGGGRLLLEETSLARRPGLPVEVLRRRLHARMRARGVEVPPDAATERVAFPVDLPVARGTGPVVAFGAAAAVVHPATGYSLAASLVMADRVAMALAERLDGALPDGRAAARAARDVVWSRQARLVHHLRRRGLEVVLALPPDRVPAFFERFFSLPLHHQRAYLSEREDLMAVRGAMWALFTAADAPLRRHLVRWGVPPIGDHRAPA